MSKTLPGNGLSVDKYEAQVVHLVSGDTLLCEAKVDLDANSIAVRRPLAIELMPIQQGQMAPIPTPWGGLLSLGLGSKQEVFTFSLNHVIITRNATVDETRLWQQSTSSIALA